MGIFPYPELRLKKLFLPDNVTTIHPMVFARNELETVIFSKNIKLIDNYSFYHNQIDRIELPKNLTSIGHGAFGSNKLTSIILSESLYEIGDEAFANNQLKEVNIPNSVRHIGKYAFYNNELTFVELPKNIDLGKGVFQENYLTTIIIPEGIYEIPAYAFFYNYLSSVSFSESVWKIGHRAFEYNNLNSIILPKIEKIEDGAFNNNPLTEITIGKNVSIGVKAMGIHSDEFIDVYEANKRKAGIYTYDKIKKEWIYQKIKSKSLISQLFAGEYSAPFYGVISVLSLLAGFLLFLLGRKIPKSKPVYSNSNEYVRAMKGKNDNRLQIFWNNEIVENVRLVELVFWNDGEKPIRQDDISENSPITVKCNSEHIKILDYSIYPESKNKNIILLEDKIIDNKIQIFLSDKEAFEKNDGFTIYITYTSEHPVEDDWIIDAKIIDAHKIRNVRNLSVLQRLGQTFDFFKWYALGGLPAAIILLVFYLLDFYSWTLYWIFIAILFIGYAVFQFFTSSEKKKHTKPKWN